MTFHRRSAEIEAEIVAVERRIFSLQDEIAAWTDASTNLSNAAAIERARNAGMGRGLGGALFGAKYRAAARRAAASDNAAIARQVAAKKAEIARAKQELRQDERGLRAALRDLKAELKAARSFEREQSRMRPPPAPSPLPPPPASAPSPAAEPVDVKAELRRLKALHEGGRLDAAAYEKARIALMQAHLRR